MNQAAHQQDAREATDPMQGRAEPIDGLTPQHVRDALVEAGCRAEIVRAPDGADMVASALHGTGFSVRFVNAYEPNPRVASRTAVGFSDVSFVYMPRIDGLPLAAEPPPWIQRAVADWNTSRRFAHLALIAQGDIRFLALRWDVLAVGVTRDHLQAVIRLWDQLMQEFFAFLRNRAAASGGAPVQALDTPLQTSGGTIPPEAPDSPGRKD